MQAMNALSIGALGILTLCSVAPRGSAAADPTDSRPSGEDIARWLASRGIRRGVCAIVGDGADTLAIDVAGRTELLVYAQVPDPAAVEGARARAEARGLDATRVLIEQGPSDRLHLADRIASAVVAVGRAPSRLPEAEASRVLRPGGRALIDARELTGPPVEGADDWSHVYHGPDNNPLSSDRAIRAPYLTQFLADPRYAPAPQSTVAAGGRVFKAFGNVAWHEREEPWLNTLLAIDGYNGEHLWTRKLPEGLMVHRSGMIATPDALYLATEGSCQVIDAGTGRILREIPSPPAVGGATFWKWIALDEGRLLALLGEPELKDPEMRWRRRAHGWPWNEISKGFNQRENPWGYGRHLVAVDPETGRLIWHHREEAPIDGRAVSASGGRVFAFRFGGFLTCLDAGTGAVRWRRSAAKDPDLFRAIGPSLGRQGWQTNWRTVVYLKSSDRALYFAGPQVGKLLAISADDGRVLWQHPYDNYQLVIRDDGLWAISGPWGQNVSKRFDPLTGEVLAELPTGRRACTRPTATADSILYRAMGGSVRLDTESGAPRWVSPMRPSCHDGVTVAGGLLYWWPYVCDCQLSLYGVTCLGSAGDFDFTPEVRSEDRLVAGPAGREVTTPLRAGPRDWPTLRASNARTATSRAVVPDRASILWSTRPSPLASFRPSAPVAADGLVLLAGSDGVVRALDAATGRRRWLARTGGPVPIPPSIAGGRALVGSADGWVLALEAATGRTLWRFRAAPAERRIPVYGRILSTWPAVSGVLVEGDTAFVAAGLANYDGTYVYALDVESGEVRWMNDSSGHLDPEARTGVSVQGHLLLDEDRLYLAGGNAVSPAVYDATDGRCLNDAAALARCESTSPRGWELFRVGRRVIACGRPFWARPEDPVYDHTVDRKLLHSPGTRTDLVWIDSREVRAYPPLDPAELSACVTDERVPRHITQAWGEFRVRARPRWTRRTPGGVALARAANAVVVALRDRVEAFGLEDGMPLWSVPLPAAPVEWGLALDRDGRAILTLEDGAVVAIGAPRRD